MRHSLFEFTSLLASRMARSRPKTRYLDESAIDVFMSTTRQFQLPQG